jgi:hypothetical protein
MKFELHKLVQCYPPGDKEDFFKHLTVLGSGMRKQEDAEQKVRTPQTRNGWLRTSFCDRTLRIRASN